MGFTPPVRRHELVIDDDVSLLLLVYGTFADKDKNYVNLFSNAITSLLARTLQTTLS